MHWMGHAQCAVMSLMWPIYSLFLYHCSLIPVQLLDLGWLCASRVIWHITLPNGAVRILWWGPNIFDNLNVTTWEESLMHLKCRRGVCDRENISFLWWL